MIDYSGGEKNIILTNGIRIWGPPDGRSSVRIDYEKTLNNSDSRVLVLYQFKF